jgi:hypothetical protein
LRDLATAPFAREKPWADWKKNLQGLWSRKKITKKAHAGRGQETQWEIPAELILSLKTPEACLCSSHDLADSSDPLVGWA